MKYRSFLFFFLIKCRESARGKGTIYASENEENDRGNEREAKGRRSSLLIKRDIDLPDFIALYTHDDSLAMQVRGSNTVFISFVLD